MQKEFEKIEIVEYREIFVNARTFNNTRVAPSMLFENQIDDLIMYTIDVVENKIPGDFVEFGCYVGESSKYIKKTLDLLKSDKRFYVYDSFEGLPELSESEIDKTRFVPGTLKTTEEVLVKNFMDNNILPPIITKGWFKDIPEKKIPNEIAFAFLDGDFYDSIMDSLKKVYDKVSDGGYIIFHDYDRDDLPGVRKAVEDFFANRNESYELIVPSTQLGVIKKKGQAKKIVIPSVDVSDNNLTIVTGLWDIGRHNRNFSHYIEHFKHFLDIPNKMFIYIEAKYEYLVWEKRSRTNTFVKTYELDDVRNMYNSFWDKTQELRTSKEWLNQTGDGGWLTDSPQAKLEWYNPIVQSKMFFLNDVTIWNPFNTDYFIWLDAGITNTVHDAYLKEKGFFDKMVPHLKTFLFLSYPYEANTEIHGFNFDAINRYAGNKVQYVCRGGLFGGRKEIINQANSTYYSTLSKTLNDGYMGTEESIFSIMAYREPNIYRRFELDGNGLIIKYVQALDEGTAELVKIENEENVKPIVVVNDNNLKDIKTNLYVLTFNFPEQVLHTINSMKKVPEWLERPHLVLLDNSTIDESKLRNREIAQEYNFEYIDLGGNTGICGGRQAAAEHFHSSNADFMFFFEDDMTVNSEETIAEVCRNGFRKYIPNLYNLVHKIMLKDDFDFLKLTFTEVYFDNDKQCSWYNVPQHIRTRDWPHYDKLPISGLDPNVPLTNFKNIRVMDGVSYIDGEVYYANWPMIVSKKGNKKMFIDTKWQHPYEQTWMSHMYQLTKEGQLKPAVLLASPIWHDRIKHYSPEERREN